MRLQSNLSGPQLQLESTNKSYLLKILLISSLLKSTINYIIFHLTNRFSKKRIKNAFAYQIYLPTKNLKINHLLEILLISFLLISINIQL